MRVDQRIRSHTKPSFFEVVPLHFLTTTTKAKSHILLSFFYTTVISSHLVYSSQVRYLFVWQCVFCEHHERIYSHPSLYCITLSICISAGSTPLCILVVAVSPGSFFALFQHIYPQGQRIQSLYTGNTGGRATMTKC
jgi:hypothetical protein